MKCNVKISIIEPVGGHGGMNYYDFGLCSGLADAGVDALLETCDETEFPHEGRFLVRHSYRGIFSKSPAWKRGLRYVFGSLVALISAVREERRICHFHMFHVGLLEAMNVLMARLCFRKVVVTAHDVESFVEKLEVPMLSRWVYCQADFVIAHNRISAHEVATRMSVQQEKIAVIPHGNYLHMLRPLPPQADARAALGLSKNAKVLLFFGQIKDVKGLDLLIRAMPNVIEQNPEALLLIAGKPWKSDFSLHEKLMNDFGVRNKCITHIRYIPDEEVSRFYAASDIVVLPYRRIYQSGVVLMAMSYGKAVLVSNLPGMTEIVSDGENGFVFRQGCDDDLALKLNAILRNDVLRKQVAMHGLEYVRRNHDWLRIGKATAELYEEVLV